MTTTTSSATATTLQSDPVYPTTKFRIGQRVQARTPRGYLCARVVGYTAGVRWRHGAAVQVRFYALMFDRIGWGDGWDDDDLIPAA